MAEVEISNLTKLLLNPKIDPSLQRIENVIALRYEIKGLQWWIEKAKDIRDQYEKEM